MLYNEMDFLPDVVAKFIKNLSKDFDSTIQHIIRPEIPNTNNLLEGYFKITLPRHLKKIFRGWFYEKICKNHIFSRYETSCN